MAKGPKGFSDAEKASLRKKLCAACEKSWAVHGYKRTTVGELVKSIGIATGSFYLLFHSKEELFCETFRQVQENLRERWQQALDAQPNKAGFMKAMHWLYREYSQSSFLYDFNNPDFLALINRLSEEEKEAMNVSGVSLLDTTTGVAGLKLKVSQEKAYAVLSTLLYTVSYTHKSRYDHFEVFDLLLQGAVSQIFE